MEHIHQRALKEVESFQHKNIHKYYDTKRWMNACFPLSDMIKSALIADIFSLSSGEKFRDVSDMTGQSLYVLLHRDEDIFVVQDENKERHLLRMEKDHKNNLTVGYAGNIYDEYRRTGNLVTHNRQLKKDIKKYAPLAIDQGIIVDKQLDYMDIIVPWHDSSETVIGDMESIRKNPQRKTYERMVEEEMMRENFSWDVVCYIHHMMQYGKNSYFRRNEYVQFLVDAIHFGDIWKSGTKNHLDGLGVSFEVLLIGLPRLIQQESYIETYDKKKIHPLDSYHINQQIKDQLIRGLYKMPRIFRDSEYQLTKSPRFQYIKNTMGLSDLESGVDDIESYVEIVDKRAR